MTATKHEAWKNTYFKGSNVILWADIQNDGESGGKDTNQILY